MSALQQIHVGRRQLGLDDDTYRAMLLRVTGKASAKDMTDRERLAVVAEMRAKGFKAASKGTGKRLSGPYSGKAQALWIALWNLGAVDDRRDAALIAFAKRQTGVDHLDWVRSAQHGSAVVEALKSWCAREGVDWSPRSELHLDRHGYCIARAQAGKLCVPSFWDTVASILKRSVLSAKPTDAEWIDVMNDLGKRVRESKAKGATC